VCRIDLSLEFCPRRRPTRIPGKFEGDVLFRENIGDSGRSKTDINTFMQTDIYYSAIDTTLTELNRRFLTDSIAVLKAVAAFIHGTDRFLNSDMLC